MPAPRELAEEEGEFSTKKIKFKGHE